MKNQSARDVQSYSWHVKVLDFAPFRADWFFTVIERMKTCINSQYLQPYWPLQPTSEQTKPQTHKATKIHTFIPLTYELFFQNSSKLKISCFLYFSSHFYFHAISWGCSQGERSNGRRSGTPVSENWKVETAWASAKTWILRIRSTSQGQRRMVWESIGNANKVETKKRFRGYLPLFIWCPLSWFSESERFSGTTLL